MNEEKSIIKMLNAPKEERMSPPIAPNDAPVSIRADQLEKNVEFYIQTARSQRLQAMEMINNEVTVAHALLTLGKEFMRY